MSRTRLSSCCEGRQRWREKGGNWTNLLKSDDLSVVDCVVRSESDLIETELKYTTDVEEDCRTLILRCDRRSLLNLLTKLSFPLEMNDVR